MQHPLRGIKGDVRGGHRLALVGVLTAVALLQAGASGAAPSGVLIEDTAGDANGVNTQGEYGFELNAPTDPVQLPEADLVEVELKPARRGYVLSFQTSAPAATGYVYGITAELGGCRVFINHERHADGAETVVYGCGYEGLVVDGKEQQRGNTLSVNLPRSIGDRYVDGTRMRAETLKLVARIPTGTFDPIFIDTATPDA